jgi:AraC-like DNA-binding protein
MVRHYRVPRVWSTKLEELGVNVPAILRAAGLPQDLFKQPRILITTEEQFALWRAIGQVAEDRTIGLKLATESKLERIHPMGIAALSADSFGLAVRHMARYKRLCAPEEIVDEMNADEWAIQFRWLLAVEAEPPVLMDYCFGWVLNIARKGTGTNLSPLRVEFVQPRAHIRDLQRHFGCSIVSGAPRNAIVFRPSDADISFVTQNTELLDMLAPQFEQELKQQSAAGDKDSFLEMVRGAIEHRLTGHRPTIEEIARDLHTSARSLQRRLQESGSTFQHVLDEARHGLARYYLSNSVLELTEAAYLLGYEDANSFARAFRSWEGMPPKDWRDAHRAETVLQ